MRAQKYEDKITSAKLEILYFGNFLETICWVISWKLYAGKFFGNYMLVTSSWNPCAGKFRGYYGTILWEIVRLKGMVSGSKRWLFSLTQAGVTNLVWYLAKVIACIFGTTICQLSKGNEKDQRGNNTYLGLVFAMKYVYIKTPTPVTDTPTNSEITTQSLPLLYPKSMKVSNLLFLVRLLTLCQLIYLIVAIGLSIPLSTP